jgi:hypothetical protein
MASPDRIDAQRMNWVNLITCAISLLAGLAFLVGGGFWIHRNYLDKFLGLITKSDLLILGGVQRLAQSGVFPEAQCS